MNLEQMKAEIIADLRHQLLQKRSHQNWTSESWYLTCPFYAASPKIRICAIAELIKEGRIKRESKIDNSFRSFSILVLVPLD